MSYLVDRKTELRFKTATVVLDRGKPRPVVVESRPNYAVVGLAGSRKRFPISWEQIYKLAEKNNVENIRLEQEATKKYQKELRETKKLNAGSSRKPKAGVKSNSAPRK
jgi:hypothetical protein